MDVIKRQQWGARAPGNLTPNPLNANSTLFVHWSAGQGRSIDTIAEIKASARAIQTMHMTNPPDGGPPWADGGYSYLVYQARGRMKHAKIVEFRRFKFVPASQFGHNTGNGSVCVIMAPGEDLKDGTIAALRQVYAHFPGKSVKGHRDVMGTDCPGDKLYRRLPDIRRAPKRTPHLP